MQHERISVPKATSKPATGTMSPFHWAVPECGGHQPTPCGATTSSPPSFGGASRARPARLRVLPRPWVPCRDHPTQGIRANRHLKPPEQHRGHAESQDSGCPPSRQMPRRCDCISQKERSGRRAGPIGLFCLGKPSRKARAAWAPKHPGRHKPQGFQRRASPGPEWETWEQIQGGSPRGEGTGRRPEEALSHTPAARGTQRKRGSARLGSLGHR